VNSQKERNGGVNLPPKVPRPKVKPANKKPFKDEGVSLMDNEKKSEESGMTESEEKEFDKIEINTEEVLKGIEGPKKNDVTSEIKEKNEEELEQDLFSEFSSYIKNQHDMEEDNTKIETIPSGIDLFDAILGGGFVVGALGIIVGQPGCGKTMLAIKALAQGQIKHKGRMLGGFLDSEEATTKIRLANLGVRLPKIKPYVDITVEKVFKFIEGLSVFKSEKKIIDTPSVVVWDSIANTLSVKETETDDPNSVIGYKARLLSILVPKYIAKCSRHKICFLAVNQLRDSITIGQFTPPQDLKMLSPHKIMPGGTVLRYNVNQLVEVKVKTIIDTEKAATAMYGFEGLIARVKCVKNKIFTPNIEIEIAGSFVTGFSNFWTNVNFLKTTKRLKTGAWNYLISMPDKKFRMKEARQIYKTDSNFQKAFDEAVKEAIQTEIVDKYNQELE